MGDSIAHCSSSQSRGLPASSSFFFLVVTAKTELESVPESGLTHLPADFSKATCTDSPGEYLPIGDSSAKARYLLQLICFGKDLSRSRRASSLNTFPGQETQLASYTLHTLPGPQTKLWTSADHDVFSSTRLNQTSRIERWATDTIVHQRIESTWTYVYQNIGLAPSNEIKTERIWRIKRTAPSVPSSSLQRHQSEHKLSRRLPKWHPGSVASTRSLPASHLEGTVAQPTL